LKKVADAKAESAKRRGQRQVGNKKDGANRNSPRNEKETPVETTSTTTADDSTPKTTVKPGREEGVSELGIVNGEEGVKSV